MKVNRRLPVVTIKPLSESEAKDLIKKVCPDTFSGSDIWDDEMLFNSLSKGVKMEKKRPVILSGCTYYESLRHAEKFGLQKSKPNEILFLNYPNAVSTEIFYENNISWLYSLFFCGRKRTLYKGIPYCFKDRKNNFLYFTPFIE